MTPPFIIAIDHADSYFSEGLKYILMNLLHRWKREVSFVSIAQKESADLIIASEEWIRLTRPCLIGHKDLKVITIRDEYGTKQEKRRICNSEIGSISRADLPETLMRLMQLVRVGKKDETVSFRRCRCCSNALSRKELYVLWGVSQGLPQAILAGHFSVSVQSISRYKRSAMTKLGFARDHELYNWFRLGGLNTSLERFSCR